MPTIATHTNCLKPVDEIWQRVLTMQNEYRDPIGKAPSKLILSTPEVEDLARWAGKPFTYTLHPSRRSLFILGMEIIEDPTIADPSAA